MTDFPNSPWDRYERDPAFRQLVDVIEMTLHQARFTPTEVREAAVMACVRFEQRNFARNRGPWFIPMRPLDTL
jgi:hypothetical protein